MFLRKSIGFLAILCVVSGLANAQTPGPLPGTPLALTCMPFVTSPGITSVESIANWNYLDRVCVVLENTTGGAIEIAGVQGYFTRTDNPLIAQLRIWEVQNEHLLPNVGAACIMVSEGTYDFAAAPVPGFPQIALVQLDLTSYPGMTKLPVINPGKKFIVDLINVTEQPSMEMTAEVPGQCPPSFWAERTNIFGNQVGATLTWNFKEDIGLPTNFYLGVTYFDNADPRTPAMGTVGLIGLLVAVSFALTGRNKKRS
ncbi:MAG: hypothetical protein WBM02_05255 [bacterium]